MMKTDSTGPTAWDTMAAVMGALFLMSGADGQQNVQAIFLLLAAVFVAAGRLAPSFRVWFNGWLRSHPQARTFLHSGATFWH